MVSVNNVGAFVPTSSVDVSDHTSPFNPITVDAPHNRRTRGMDLYAFTQGEIDWWSKINGNAPTNWDFVDRDSMLSRNFQGGIDYKVNPGGGSSALRSYNLTIASITWLLLNEQVKINNDGGTGAVINGSHIRINGGTQFEIRAIDRAFGDAQGIAQQILAYPGDYNKNYETYMRGFGNGFKQGYSGGSDGPSGGQIERDGFQKGRDLAIQRREDGTLGSSSEDYANSPAALPRS